MYEVRAGLLSLLTRTLVEIQFLQIPKVVGWKKNPKPYKLSNGKKRLDFAITFGVMCSWQLMDLAVCVPVTSVWGHPFFI